MNTITKNKLKIFADTMEGSVGWINKVKDFWGEQAEEYVEKYIDDKGKYFQKEKDYYFSKELLKVREDLKKFKEENKEFAKECQIRKKEELKENYDKKYKLLEQSLEHYGNLEEKKELLKEVEALGKEMNSKIDSEMIEKAKNYPITDLIEVNKKNFALCINHEDHNPSMFCKNNFVYCFSCGFSSDPIGVAMKIYNLSFTQAVLKLQ